MSSPGEIDSHGIKWLFAHGTIITQTQTRDNPGDHRWSHDTPGAGKGYEVTWIISPTGVTPGTGGSAGHTALKHGGPNHSGDCGGGYMEDGSCCCWYDIGIRANGDLQFQIERPHPSNSDFDPGGAQLFDNVGHEMDGHDTGLKIVAYPHITGGTAENGGIHIKYYINSNALTNGVPNNNWRLAADLFDTGQILGDGYEWPDYQELEVRNSDTDESGFYNDVIYIRMLTDADLAALRSGNPGGGGGDVPTTGEQTQPGPGAVVNTTFPVPEDKKWNLLSAEKVIKSTLQTGLLPIKGVDFANEWYCVIGPVDGELYTGDIPGSTPTAPPPTGPVTRDVNISETVDLVFSTSITGSGSNSRKEFDVALAEEMVEVQTDPFAFDGVPAWQGPSLGDDPMRQIGDTPCDFAMGTEGNQPYADGLQVEAYWSNADDDCVIWGLTSGGTGSHADPLTYHGGPVMKTPKIYMIFWGKDWETRTAQPTKSQLVQDCRDKLLGTDSDYFGYLSQYSGCGVPIWGGAVQYNNNTLYGGSNTSVDDWLTDDNMDFIIADVINTGLISLMELDFNNTQFIIIPEIERVDEDLSFGAYHTDYVASITFPPGSFGANENPSTVSTATPVSSGQDVFKPTLTISAGGGQLPPDVPPPPGATTIQPFISWGVVQVVDAESSIIHESFPDWDDNNTITRPLVIALIHSQTNTDKFARFGPQGYRRSNEAAMEISDSPCAGPANVDNIHIYGDGLGLQAYWSNSANNCVVPGRGDPDLGTSTDITYHGGRIMKNPLVVLIFWGQGWITRVAPTIPTVESITEDIKDKLLDNDKVYFSQLGQYGGCGVPQFGASIVNNSIPYPSDALITTTMAMNVIKSTLQNGSLPTHLIDYNNTWFCVIPDVTSDVVDPVTGSTNIGYWHDVFNPTIVIPGSVPDDPGGTPDPNDLETFSGVLSFKRDINLMRVSSCAGTDVVEPPPDPEEPPPPPVDPPIGGTAKFYIVTGTSNQKEISNESSSDDRTQITEKVNSSSSAMNGKLLKQADVLLKKESGTTVTTPLIYFKIWDGSNNVVYTSPTTFTPNELTTSFVGKTFDCSTNTHTLVVGDRVGCEWTGTDPSEFIWTAYVTSDSGSTGSSGSYSVYKEGSSYDNQTGRRTSMTLWT